MAAASAIWGVTGLYLSTLSHISALEVLTHRTFWSLIFFLGLFALQGRLKRFFQVLTDRAALKVITISALMVTTNWGLFIWAVHVGRATQASFGYYIFPLVAALLGTVILKEPLRPATRTAIVLAAIAVCILAWDLGSFPWLSITLAASFGVYGLVKRRLEVSAIVSVAVETALISPILLVWLFIWGPGTEAFANDIGTAAKLIGLVLVTGLPLVFFSLATQKLNYATLGLIQYINPTLQFAVAILLLGEEARPAYALALPLIWLGLGIFSYDALYAERAARKRSISSGTSETTLK